MPHAFYTFMYNIELVLEKLIRIIQYLICIRYIRFMMFWYDYMNYLYPYMTTPKSGTTRRD